MTSTYTSGNVTLDKYIDALNRLVALAQAQWGTSVNTAEDEILGHILRNIALLVGEINEVVQSVYDGFAVSNSSGTQLDNLMELIGLDRQAAAYSTATLSIKAIRDTVVPAGSRFSTSTTGLVFATDTALTFAEASYPATKTVASTCTITGDNNAAIAEIDTVDTPIFGLDDTLPVTNLAAAIPGRDRETDAELKARHTTATSGSGAQDTSSIYEAVAAVTGVSSVDVVENDTSATVDSVPAHAVHVVVVGGSDANVAAAIGNNIVSGVSTYGSTSVDVYNSTTGRTKTVNFDRATPVPIYIDIEYTPETGVFPTNGEALIKEYLVDLFSELNIGDDVIYNKLYRPIYTVPGVDLSSLEVDVVDPPTGTSDIAITSLQIATLSSSNITITDVTP